MSNLDLLEEDLRALVRTKMSIGSLPNTEPTFVRCINTRSACAVCQMAITGQELCFLVEINFDVFPFHFLCHAAWALECARAAIIQGDRNGHWSPPPHEV
jgi:hypothetical protein